MKNKIKLFATLICLSTLLAYFLPKNALKEANAEYGWESAFYNDMDNDGTKELLPYIYKGKTSITKKYFYTASNCVSYDSTKYGGPTSQEDKRIDDDYNYLVETYEVDPYDDYETLLIEKYGENSEQYQAIKKEYDDYMAFVNEYDEKYNNAYKLWQQDVSNFSNEHPEIVFNHNVNESLTKTEVKDDDSLLYWLHVPYDYNPSKSYPVFVLANGEWSTWNKTTYLNDDGTYKGDKFDPPDSYQMNTICNSWYNLVKDPGQTRDEYDCFFLYILNTNEFFRGGGAIGIVNQYNDYDIEDARNLTSDDTGDASYNATYSRTYVASELSPGYQEQLVCQLIDDMAKTYNIDKSRQYVSGFSLGGILAMDIISHYPDRFACSVPICTASADITENNCKALTHTNVWAISGNNDGTCNKYFSKLFVDSINNARDKYHTGIEHVAQYSFFTGGHSGGQAQCRKVDATSGVSMISSTHLMEFIFNSKREDITTDYTLQNKGTLANPYTIKEATDVLCGNAIGNKEDIYIKGVVCKNNGHNAIAIKDSLDSNESYNILNCSTTINKDNLLEVGNVVILKGSIDFNYNMNNATLVDSEYVAVNEFANSFNKDFATLCSSNLSNNNSNLTSDFIDKWNKYVESYALLSSTEKEVLSKSSVIENGNNIEKFLAKYSYIINKYSSLNRFIKGNINLQNINKTTSNVIIDNNSFNISMAIIIPTIVLTIGIYYIDKKKKNSKKTDC